MDEREQETWLCQGFPLIGSYGIHGETNRSTTESMIRFSWEIAWNIKKFRSLAERGGLPIIDPVQLRATVFSVVNIVFACTSMLLSLFELWPSVCPSNESARTLSGLRRWVSFSIVCAVPGSKVPRERIFRHSITTGLWFLRFSLSLLLETCNSGLPDGFGQKIWKYRVSSVYIDRENPQTSPKAKYQHVWWTYLSCSKCLDTF